MLTVRIFPNESNSPAGKLADAELHFSERSDPDPLDGLKLVGFAIWERRTGGGRNVTFPARSYSINGERRSFSLLRPARDGNATDRIRDLILDAYAKFEADEKALAGLEPPGAGHAGGVSDGDNGGTRALRASVGRVREVSDDGPRARSAARR